ncbi:MAG: hypothetical protein KIT87_21140 [Anaerolineae bacterium]|nr:hypothetical protein [Anaerolineae bacterium]
MLATTSSGYGLLVQWLAVWPSTLTTLVWAQVLAGAVTAWLAAFILVRYLGVQPLTALLVAIAGSVEPLQVLHERLVLAEAFTQLLWATYLLLGLVYLRRPRLISLVAVCGVGLLLVTLRVAYVPLAWGSVLLPVLPLLARRVGRTPNGMGYQPIVHLVVGLVVMLGLHSGYRAWMGARTHMAPTYLPYDGYHIASAWAPLLIPADASDPPARQVLSGMLAEDPSALRDRFRREENRWLPGGLVARLHAAFEGDDLAGSRAAQAMAMTAAWRNPLAVLKLGVQSYLDHWRLLPMLEARLRVEQGSDRPLDAPFVALLGERFGLDATHSAETMTLSRRYHLAAQPWYIVLLLAPALILLGVLLAKPAARLAALWLLLTSSTILLALGAAYAYHVSPPSGCS